MLVMFGMLIMYSVSDDFIDKACSRDEITYTDSDQFEACTNFVASWFLLFWAILLFVISTIELMWVSVFKGYRDELTEFGAEGY